MLSIWQAGSPGPAATTVLSDFGADRHQGSSPPGIGDT